MCIHDIIVSGRSLKDEGGWSYVQVGGYTPTRSSFPISPNTKYILVLLQHHDLMGLEFGQGAKGTRNGTCDTYETLACSGTASACVGGGLMDKSRISIMYRYDKQLPTHFPALIHNSLRSIPAKVLCCNVINYAFLHLFAVRFGLSCNPRPIIFFAF